VSIVYFDSNVCVGKRGLKDYREIWRSEDILDAMDHAGISGALVFAGWSKDYAPDYGNQRLIEEIEKSGNRFYGCYTIVPGYTGCFKKPDEIIPDLKAKNMVAAKMFPKTHCYSTDEITMGEYYSALENAEVPLLVDSSEITWPALGDVLKNHPKLNVIVLGVYWSDTHNAFAYMRKFTNLYVDLSNMQSNYVIEKLVENFGAERIVYGSGLPKMSPGAARAFIDYAQISDDAKKLIAGGNLARLCGVELPAAVEVKGDEIAQEASQGKPLSVYVFDSHAHFLENNGCCGSGFAMVDGDLDHMLFLADKMGVEDHCVAPWPGIWTDSEAGNEIVADMWKRSKRVYPYVLIDPNYVTDIEGTAYKYHVEQKMPAMKMFFSRIGTRYNDPKFDPWWKIANDNYLYGLMDSGGYPGYLNDMADLAEKYPNVAIFLDHAGRDFKTAEAYAAVAKKYDNVYLQLTFTSVPQGLIEYLCAEGLADKTMYGTDAPMRDPRPQLGWVAYANISTEDKKKILGGNMRRVADRCFKK